MQSFWSIRPLDDNNQPLKKLRLIRDGELKSLQDEVSSINKAHSLSESGSASKKPKVNSVQQAP